MYFVVMPTGEPGSGSPRHHGADPDGLSRWARDMAARYRVAMDVREEASGRVYASWTPDGVNVAAGR